MTTAKQASYNSITLKKKSTVIKILFYDSKWLWYDMNIIQATYEQSVSLGYSILIKLNFLLEVYYHLYNAVLPTNIILTISRTVNYET